MKPYCLKSLYEAEIFSRLDTRFAEFLARFVAHSSEIFLFTAALISFWTRQGNICLDLPSLAGQPLPLENSRLEGCCPDLEEWLAALDNISVIQPAGHYAPLILSAQKRLYLHRYWTYEHHLSEQILARLRAVPDTFDEPALAENLQRLFPTRQGDPDGQKMAALTAVRQRFCVISGGPGTGKTTTVVKLLALLLEQTAKPLRIALLAPTGKAAMRLQQAISQHKQTLPCEAAILQQIPEETATIHRFLGYRPDSPYFRFNQHNQAAVDVVVIDEASMVDLALMSKLLEAIPKHARLILLGDKDQLASVEAGAVLGDLCAGVSHPQPTQVAAQAVVVLQHSYRFGSHSAIGQFAHAINSGNTPQAVQCLQQANKQQLRWFDHADVFDKAVADLIVQGFRPYLQQREAQAALQAFEQFRVLCAHRQGDDGVSKVNQLIEKYLIRENLLRIHGRWYVGQPLMITQNDYNLRLFNGDIGIVMPDPQQPQRLLVYFRTAEQQIRALLPVRLPQHQTAYAMTIHKSQGSEFDQVLLVLPNNSSPVLSRELLYTGVTRAKQSVAVLGSADILNDCIQRRAARSSGLREALQAADCRE